MKVVIVDYGMGNLRSVEKAFRRLGIDSVISSDSSEILSADKLVLPGVGHFNRGMQNIKERKIFDVLYESVLIKKKQILGICLGMQLMTEYSEEGDCEGLGWIKAKTVKFSFNNNNLKIPHMGWNNLDIQNDISLLKNITGEDSFYFVHSYYVNCENEENVLAKTNYNTKFVSAFYSDNIFGCQFHPEKSHDKGLEIIKNFTEL